MEYESPSHYIVFLKVYHVSQLRRVRLTDTCDIKGILSKFSDDARLGEAPDSLECREAQQRDFDKSEVWEMISHKKFNKDKCWILYLAWGLYVQTGK